MGRLRGPVSTFPGAKPRPSHLCTQGQDLWLDWGPATGSPGSGTLESPLRANGGRGAHPIQLSGTYSRFSIDMVEDLDQRNLQTLQLGELAVRYSPAKPDKPAGGLCPGHCTARPSSSHVLSTRPHVHVASPCVFPQLSSTRPRCTDKPSPGSVLLARSTPAASLLGTPALSKSSLTASRPAPAPSVIVSVEGREAGRGHVRIRLACTETALAYMKEACSLSPSCGLVVSAWFWVVPWRLEPVKQRAFCQVGRGSSRGLCAFRQGRGMLIPLRHFLELWPGNCPRVAEGHHASGRWTLVRRARALGHSCCCWGMCRSGSESRSLGSPDQPPSLSLLPGPGLSILTLELGSLLQQHRGARLRRGRSWPHGPQDAPVVGREGDREGAMGLRQRNQV